MKENAIEKRKIKKKILTIYIFFSIILIIKKNFVFI
jgi:hypothetical protein